MVIHANMFDKAFSLHKQDLLKGTVLRDFQPFFDQKVLPYCRYYLVFAKVFTEIRIVWDYAETILKGSHLLYCTVLSKNNLAK